MRYVRVIAALALVLTTLGLSHSSEAATGEQYFPQTGHSVVGIFLSYWQQHGGLERFGYPLSDEIQEQSDLNGKTYTVQYFERAEFEHHPENQPPYDVELAQLGTLWFKQKYLTAPTDIPSTSSDTQIFAETGKSLGGPMLEAWQRLGGLNSIGYPISNEFGETSELDGKNYKVQYFERAEFEYHPENQPPNDVLLTQLGRFAYDAKYNAPAPTPPAWPSTTQFPITQVADKPVAAGHYLFWVHFDPKDYKGALKNEWESAIYGYDFDTKQQFVVTTEYSYKFAIASDGVTLAWSQYTQPNHSQIMGFDISTRQIFTILDVGSASFGKTMALDKGTVYYVLDPGGLYAYNLAAKQNWLIDVAGRHPLADNGAVLWEERQYTGQSSPDIVTLHLLNAQNERLDNIITDDNNCLSGYNLSEDKVVISYSKHPFGCPANKPGLSLYNPANGKITTLSASAAVVAATSGNLITWFDLTSDTSSFGTVDVYNMDTRTNRTLLKGSQVELSNLTLADNILFYTVQDSLDYGAEQIYMIDLAAPSAPPLVNPATLLGTGISSSPPAIAGHSLFWLSSKCGFCGYDVDKHEQYIVESRSAMPVDIRGNGSVLTWIEASATSQGDIHAFDPTFRTEKIIMYANGYNITDYAVDGQFVYYRGTVKDQPGIYQYDIINDTSMLLASSRGAGKLVAADGTLVWSEVRNNLSTLHILRSDGSMGDTAVAQVQGNVSFYNVSGDNIVWVEPFTATNLNQKIHLYNITSGSDKVITSGNVDRPVINGNRVAWITLQGNPKPWSVTAYNIDNGASAVVASGDKNAVADIALVGQDVLAYTADIGLISNGLYLVSLK